MTSLPLFELGAINTEPYTWAPPAAMPAAPAVHTARWFVRCVECLSIAAVTERPDATWQCAACNGAIENMGRVERGRLVHEHHASPCDDRCTNARGPHCDCKCGSKNHGSRRTVLVIRDGGKVPQVRMLEPTAALRTATEYRELRSRALEMLDALRARRRNGEFLPRSDFERMRALQLALRKTHEARSHVARLRTLNAALASD